MNNFSFDHAHLRSTDPEGLARWFEAMFDATVTLGTGRIAVQLGGCLFFISGNSGSAGLGAAPDHPHLGLDHIGFSTTDIDDVVADLRRKGVEFAEDLSTVRPGVRICFIRGPENISIEIFERNSKYT